MAEDKWYNSDLAKGIGVGLAAFGILSGMGMVSYSEDKSKVAIAEANSKVEYQRLRTLEEVVNKYGNTLPPQELDQLLQKYDLGKK
ncbi:MAG: hypothetical protein Q7K45_02120 [Nanoarchaeota archaeon]|nr:hypothetical protein [Nanoarchaeota archaeon]